MLLSGELVPVNAPAWIAARGAPVRRIGVDQRAGPIELQRGDDRTRIAVNRGDSGETPRPCAALPALGHVGIDIDDDACRRGALVEQHRAAADERLDVELMRRHQIDDRLVDARGLVVLGTSRLVHAAHDLSGMVFGNAMAVTGGELAALAVVFVVVAGTHTFFEKELVFSSFDPETAGALGVRVGLWDTVLFASVGVAIPPAARALGALPVFALLTLPAAGALLTGRRLRASIAIAGVTGVLAAGGGYLLSWFAETPTGATMVVVAAALVLPAIALRALRR